MRLLATVSLLALLAAPAFAQEALVLPPLDTPATGQAPVAAPQPAAPQPAPQAAPAPVAIPSPLSAPEQPKPAPKKVAKKKAAPAKDQASFEVINAVPPEPQPVPPAMLAPSAGGCPPMAVRISHGVTFLTGGTTQGEIEQFRDMDAEFNLQLLLASKMKDHLVAEQVRLLDYKGFELVKTTAAGPYFYAYIRPGSYKLEVTLEPGAKPIFVDFKVGPKGRERKTIVLK